MSAASTPAAGISTRYELAWTMPYADVGDGKASNNAWWFDADFASGTMASAYLKAIEGTVCAQRGGAAIYEVGYVGGKMVSERLLTFCGAHQPPLRGSVQPPNRQLRNAFAQLIGTAPPPKRKSSGWAIAFGSLIFVTVFGGAMYAAVVFAVSPVRSLPGNGTAAASPKIDPDAGMKRQGQVLVPRTNSQICDRFLFDNNSGIMKTLESQPCDQRNSPANLAEQANSFSSGWRGTK